MVPLVPRGIAHGDEASGSGFADFVCPGIVLGQWPPVVVVSHFLWDALLGVDREPVGRCGAVNDARPTGGVVDSVNRLLPFGAHVILQEVASTQHAQGQEYGSDNGGAAAPPENGHAISIAPA